MSALPERLAEIVEDFRACERQEKLECLLQYAGELPPFPHERVGRNEDLHEVPECMTPVQIFAELEDGRLLFHFEVPDQSPTVRGFAAILGSGLRGATPLEVLQVPNDFYLETGLQHVLSPQRLNGLTAILAHLKQIAAGFLGSEGATPVRRGGV
jgi:cysteine desulfuration protein SufE